MFKDAVMNSVLLPQNAMLPAAAPTSNEPLEVGFVTISTVASQMGHKFDMSQLMKIGTAVKNAYRIENKKLPPKHEQFVNGAVRNVNTYETKDRRLIERVIREFKP